MHPAHAQLNTLDFSIWAWIKCIHKCDGLHKSIGKLLTKDKRGRWEKNILCEPLACASERRNPLARANESVSNKLHSIIYSEVPFPFTAVLNKLPVPLPLPSLSLWAHIYPSRHHCPQLAGRRGKWQSALRGGGSRLVMWHLFSWLEQPRTPSSAVCKLVLAHNFSVTDWIC